MLLYMYNTYIDGIVQHPAKSESFHSNLHGFKLGYCDCTWALDYVHATSSSLRLGLQSCKGI